MESVIDVGVSVLRRFITDAKQASGAVLDPHISITLIIRGAEIEYAFDSVLTEARALQFLSRRNVSVHRHDQMIFTLFAVYLVGLLVLISFHMTGVI